MNPIDMKRFENLKFGVELDSKGKILNDAQGYLLKTLNIMGFSGVLILATIVIGVIFRQAFWGSPLLMVFGHIVSFVILIVAQAGTTIWWFITGIKGPMEFIYSALPFGTAQLKASVCIMPFTIVILVIVIRVYYKVYITKKMALIISLGLISCNVGLSMWLENLL